MDRTRAALHPGPPSRPHLHRRARRPAMDRSQRAHRRALTPQPTSTSSPSHNADGHSLPNYQRVLDSAMSWRRILNRPSEIQPPRGAAHILRDPPASDAAHSCSMSHPRRMVGGMARELNRRCGGCRFDRATTRIRRLCRGRMLIGRGLGRLVTACRRRRSSGPRPRGTRPRGAIASLPAATTVTQ